MPWQEVLTIQEATGGNHLPKCAHQTEQAKPCAHWLAGLRGVQVSPDVLITMPLAEPISTDCQYSQHVNPQWVKLLNVLELSVSYERCIGAELFTRDGRRVLDFLS